VLKFHSHVSTIVSKANRILGMIKRWFTTLNQSTLLVLYKHLVRTQLEYCNTVWNHSYLTDMAKLKKVKWRATRILPTLRSLCYKERLHHLKLPTLSYQQWHVDCFSDKWFCGSWCHWVFWSLNDYTYQGHSYKLFTRHTRTDIRKSFANRIIKKWNSLPSNIAPLMILRTNLIITLKT